MQLLRPEFEGVIYGIPELPFRKIAKLFANAFEQCEYEFIEDKAGAMMVSGTKDLLLSEADRTAMFDLVCDLLTDDAYGTILARTWENDGTVELTRYTFRRGGWEEEAVALP
jgi:hypothetical protein